MAADDRSYMFGALKKGGGFRSNLVLIAASVALIGSLAAVLWWKGFGTDDIVRVVREEPAAPADPAAPAPLASASVKTAATDASDARQAVAKVEQVVEQQGGMDSRLAAMEQRLTKLDLQTQAATGNAARAEGLLITFAARRAIERGTELGYLGDQLQMRFGDARPNAVRTILEGARKPVTLDQLIARLDGLAPKLVTLKANDDLLGWLGNEVSGLFVVRRESTPSPQPERRLQRARLFLESSRPEAAVAEVRALPNAKEAAAWIADAERYAKVQQALELLETTAILESRGLRDGSGAPVEQLSPAGERAGN